MARTHSAPMAAALALLLGACAAPPAHQAPEPEAAAPAAHWSWSGGGAAAKSGGSAAPGQPRGLSLSETQALWAELNPDGSNHVPVGEVEAALRGYDTDGDGFISYEEFEAGQLAAPPASGVFADMDQRLLVSPALPGQSGYGPRYPLLRR